jgi:hypothetical protein
VVAGRRRRHRQHRRLDVSVPSLREELVMEATSVSVPAHRGIGCRKTDEGPRMAATDT